MRIKQVMTNVPAHIQSDEQFIEWASRMLGRRIKLEPFYDGKIVVKAIYWDDADLTQAGKP